MKLKFVEKYKINKKSFLTTKFNKPFNNVSSLKSTITNCIQNNKKLFTKSIENDKETFTVNINQHVINLLKEIIEKQVEKEFKYQKKIKDKNDKFIQKKRIRNENNEYLNFNNNYAFTPNPDEVKMKMKMKSIVIYFVPNLQV